MDRSNWLLTWFLVTLSLSAAHAADREFVLPASAKHDIVSCRTGNDFNLAHCINSIVRLKDSALDKAWKITVKSGTYSLKDAIVLFGVKNLELTGEPNAPAPELRASGLPLSRLQHQYFSLLIVNSEKVTVRGLNFSGEDLGSQRAIAVCPLTGGAVSGIDLSRNSFSNYTLFTVIVGNSPEPDSLTDIAGYAYSDNHPLKKFAQFLKGIPEANRYCGGNLTGLAFRQNVVRMKSVGFYLVPPMGKVSGAAEVAEPVTGDTNLVPTWYGDSETMSRKYAGIVVEGNQFLNDELDYGKAKANQYHSAMKLHWSYGTLIANNVIEAADLPQSFESGAAINLGPGMYGALVQGNTITLAPGLRNPFGIGLISSFLTHSGYGYGDKKVFGALSGVTLKENTLNHAVIRFMDCCVQVENSDTNTRPYCQARDFLVKNKTGVEKIVLLHNRMNGIPYMDHNLIWRQSQKEKAWVKHYQDREAAGLGGIYCRRYMGVNYYSQDGIPR